MFWYPHVAHALFPENAGHCLQRYWLAMHHEGSTNWTAHPANPRAELVAVGMGRVARDRLNFSLPLVLLAEYPNGFLPAFYSAAQGVLRLKTHKENQVAVVADAVREMVQYATRFHHTRRGYDHRRPVTGIDCLGLRDVAHVAQQGK